jgi:hypothetical protein
MIRRALLFSAILAATSVPVYADPTAAPSAAPATAAPSVPVPSLPKGIQNSPYGQAASDVIQGYLKRQRELARNGAHGKVTYYRGYDLQVYDDPLPFLPAHYRNIHLHRGTVINPRGVTLTPGMVVDVSGQTQPDGSLNADYITVVQ